MSWESGWLFSFEFDSIRTTVLATYSGAKFELLWPYDVNFATCYYTPDIPYPQGGRLNRAVNLPSQFLTQSGSGLGRLKMEADRLGHSYIACHGPHPTATQVGNEVPASTVCRSRKALSNARPRVVQGVTQSSREWRPRNPRAEFVCGSIFIQGYHSKTRPCTIRPDSMPGSSSRMPRK